MIKKTGVIGGLDLPEKAEHTREIAFLLRNASEFIFPGIIYMLNIYLVDLPTQLHVIVGFLAFSAYYGVAVVTVVRE